MIKKAPLTTIALVCFLTTFAQVKITQTTFNGETYNVYPVRLPFNSAPYYLNYEYRDFISYDRYRYSRRFDKKRMKKGEWNNEAYELFMPYNPFELPDGKYLAYYQKRKLKFDDIMQPIYSHEDTTLVAVTFTLTNNKKNGLCTWYDYGEDGNILQKGHYNNGEKTENWTLYRDNIEHNYAYKDGELHGNYQVTNSGKIFTTSTYVNGSLNGEHLTYFEKSDQIKIHLVYEFGAVVERKEFNKKGELTYWYNRNTKDDIYRKQYKDGIIIEENFWVDTTGVGKTITYYDNGTKHQEYLKFYPEVYRKYNDAHLSDEEGRYIYGYYNYPLNSIMSATNSVTGISRCLKMEEFNPDGSVAISFDLRKDSMLNPVTRYNEDSKKINVYRLDTSTYRMGLYVQEFNPKTGLLANEHLLRGGYSRSMNKFYDEDGNLTRFDYDLNYLEQLYPDSTGFVQTEFFQNKKETIKTYEMLFSSDGIYGYGRNATWEAKTYKGREYSTFTSRNYVEDSIPWTEMQYSIFDKKGNFEVRHTRRYITPKIRNKKGHYLQPVYSYYESLSTGKKNLREEADSLDYQIFYNGIPFSGRVLIKSKYRRPEHYYKIKYKEAKQRSNRDAIVKVKDFHSYGSKKAINTMQGYVTDMGPYYRSRYYFGSSSMTYDDNKKEGEISENSYDYLPRSSYYVKGKRHGLSSSSSSQAEYYHGQLHGPFISLGYHSPDEHYRHQIDYRANFTLDTLNGWFYSYVRPMEVSQSLYFDHGIPTGKYWRGNVTAPTSAEVTLNHGYLVDTAYYYFNEGVLKAKVHHELKDSVYFDLLYETHLSSYQNARDTLLKHTDWSNEMIEAVTAHHRRPNFSVINKDKVIDLVSTRTGDYTYYYKNGLKASEGRVLEGAKVGTWRYWDLSGGLYKEVEYDTGWFVNPITNDSTYFYGRVKMWYPNGKELLTGLILSQEERFRCDQEMKVDFENLYYLTFHDKDGKLTLTNHGGKVYEYHNNSEIRLEGEMANGKRSGVWKFYDPNGRLEEVGRYEDGEKTGLWVSGDLEAVPYYEDMCVDGEVDAYKFPDVKDTGIVTQEIKIKESRYVKGTLFNSRSITLYPLY